MRRLLLALSLLLSWPALAETVDLQLVLAVDVSRSVDDEEFQLQREGYANAFKNPQVLATILTGPNRAIGVTYMEWSNAHLQRQIVKWTRISDSESAAIFADEILTAPRAFAGWTSISGAIDYGMRLLELSPFQSERIVFDISGDGSNNSGRPVAEARDDALRLGITINGLPIVNERPSPWLPAEPNLDEYYLKNVIGGPGSFALAADSFETFGQYLARKLILEIASR